MNVVDYTVELNHMCAELEGVIEGYVDCVHLIAGDFNFERNTNNVGCNIFNNIATDCGLKCINVWIILMINAVIRIATHH